MLVRPGGGPGGGSHPRSRRPSCSNSESDVACVSSASRISFSSTSLAFVEGLEESSQLRAKQKELKEEEGEVENEDHSDQPTESTLFCTLCQCVVSARSSILDAHLAGRRHRSRLRSVARIRVTLTVLSGSSSPASAAPAAPTRSIASPTATQPPTTIAIARPVARLHVGLVPTTSLGVFWRCLLARLRKAQVQAASQTTSGSGSGTTVSQAMFTTHGRFFGSGASRRVLRAMQLDLPDGALAPQRMRVTYTDDRGRTRPLATDRDLILALQRMADVHKLDLLVDGWNERVAAAGEVSEKRAAALEATKTRLRPDAPERRQTAPRSPPLPLATTSSSSASHSDSSSSSGDSDDDEEGSSSIEARRASSSSDPAVPSSSPPPPSPPHIPRSVRVAGIACKFFSHDPRRNACTRARCPFLHAQPTTEGEISSAATLSQQPVRDDASATFAESDSSWQLVSRASRSRARSSSVTRRGPETRTGRSTAGTSSTTTTRRTTTTTTTRASTSSAATTHRSPERTTASSAVARKSAVMQSETVKADLEREPLPVATRLPPTYAHAQLLACRSGVSSITDAQLVALLRAFRILGRPVSGGSSPGSSCDSFDSLDSLDSFTTTDDDEATASLATPSLPSPPSEPWSCFAYEPAVFPSCAAAGDKELFVDARAQSQPPPPPPRLAYSSSFAFGFPRVRLARAY